MNCWIVCLVVASVLRSGVSAQVPETTSYPQAPTSFTCHGRPPGYYADLETGCRTYHVCDGHSHFTYVCPKRTLFQQRTRICDHSYLVRCEDSLHFYESENLHPESVGLRESEESLLSSGNSEGNHNRTEDFIPTEKPTSENSSVRPDEESADRSIQKFLKIHIKDFRHLFFIPEFENNSVVAKPGREFLLAVEKPDFVRFKSQKEISDSFSPCPAHCDPKFFLPGTCHPCIFMK